MATYNGEKYIKEQLQSILSQLSESDEVIVSDDNSVDDTISIIESFKDPRIKIFHSHFQSPIYNFENALLKSTGDIIFLSDQDDIWLPNKVQVMLGYMRTYNCVISDASLIDDSGNVIFGSFFKLNNSKSGLIMNLISNAYLGCAMCFDRKILVRALPFPKDIEMHDRWLGIISEVYGKTYFCDDILFKYRRHGGNVSQASEKSINNFYKKISIRYFLLKNLMFRVFSNLIRKDGF